MLFFDGGLALLALAVWIFCIIDVITTPEPQIRNLPKVVWLLIVIILSDIGSIAWLVAGRNWSGRTADLPYKGNRGNRSNLGSRVEERYPEYDRPGRYVPSNPDDDEEFLARLRARAEEQRRRAREAQQGQHGQQADPPKDEPPPAQS
jgi:hypothetical protein